MKNHGVFVPDCTIDFFAFPREIRDRIYECVLTEPNLILSTCKKGATTPRFYAASNRNRNVLDLNIFRTSKQVFLEARTVFFRQNVFDINIVQESDNVRYNFVPTEWEYAIAALRHIKLFVHIAYQGSKSFETVEYPFEKLKYILERATDLRTLELWVESVEFLSMASEMDKDPVYVALGCVKNLQRLKLVVDRGSHHKSAETPAKLLQSLRNRMLANASKTKSNAVWAAYDSRGQRYKLLMSHDDYRGNSLLSKAERRYFQTDQVHEYRGENMEQVMKVDM